MAGERFAIEGYYYDWVTGQRDKMGETHMEWARTYPRDYIPHLRLNAYYRFTGQFEQALSEARQALERSPDDVSSIYALLITYVRMNRFDDAKQVYEEAHARKLTIGRTITRKVMKDRVALLSRRRQGGRRGALDLGARIDRTGANAAGADIDAEEQACHANSSRSGALRRHPFWLRRSTAKGLTVCRVSAIFCSK